MRISYGIFGYGRGHATRAAAVLAELTRRHTLQVLAGGDAWDQLSGSYPILKIPTLGYCYGPQGRPSALSTVRRNLLHVVDILGGGPTLQMVCREIADFRPDVVISDAEPWTHRAAARLGVPRIGFDHFGILVYCRPRIPLRDWLGAQRDALVYRLLMGRPQRVLVSSFYDAPPARGGVCNVGPLLRDEVLGLRPQRGPHVLAYFNKGQHQFTPRVHAALRECGAPFLVYGVNRRGVEGNLDFRPLSNLPFLEDLARCRAVFSTAGNQLVGEALHLGKPLLVMPEDCVEQRINAAAIEHLGVGMQVAQNAVCADVFRRFLAREAEFLPAIRRAVRLDGRSAAVEAIERFLRELCPAAAGAARGALTR